MGSIDEGIVKLHMKFTGPTSRLSVRLKFSMQIQVVDGFDTVIVESTLSHPFIIITNECQYEECMGYELAKEQMKGSI